MKRSDLVGAWAYHRWRIAYEDGRVTEPFGDGAVGLLLYTDDGYMSATIMSALRKPFKKPNPRDSSVRERASAFDSYFSYAGRWRLVRGRIAHEVSVALNPGLVGSEQWRTPLLQGRQLILSADEQTKHGVRRHELHWRRGTK